MKIYVQKLAMIGCIAITIFNTVHGVEKIDVLNNFRAIMKGVTTIINYVPKLSAITVPLIGDPNANPPIEGAIDKERKTLDASFKPIKDKLFVLEQIESDQAWLVEMACLKGSKTVVDDVKTIQSILNGTLDTLKAGLTDIHQLTNSPELEHLQNSIAASDSIKQVMVQIAELHPEIQKAAEQAGVITAPSVATATQTPTALAQPSQITYQRLFTIRNTGKALVRIKQLNIPENSKDMFGTEVETVDGKRLLMLDKAIAAGGTVPFEKVTNGSIDLEFTYPNKVITAQVPAGEEKTVCIDVNEEVAKTVSCDLQSLTYTRTFNINNTGKTAAVGRQINIRGIDLLGNNKPNRPDQTIQEFGTFVPNRPTTLGNKVSTGPLDLEFQFLTADNQPTGQKSSGSIPAVAPSAKTCIEFNETSVKVVQGGWCDQAISGPSRDLTIKNEGRPKVALLQINIPQGATDMFNHPLSAGATTLDFGSIAGGTLFPWDNVSTDAITIQFTYPYANPLPPLTIPAGVMPVCIVVNENGATQVDCPK
jgi:hypothetical protein